MVNGPRAKISRRQFAGVCIGAAAAGRAIHPVLQVDGTHSIPSSDRVGGIDQNPIRRRGTGLRALDPARTSPGLTLFSPMDGSGIVYLIDLDGNVVQTWKMPYPPGLFSDLTEKGTLFYSGQIRNGSSRGQGAFKGCGGL